MYYSIATDVVVPNRERLLGRTHSEIGLSIEIRSSEKMMSSSFDYVYKE